MIGPHPVPVVQPSPVPAFYGYSTNCSVDHRQDASRSRIPVGDGLWLLTAGFFLCRARRLVNQQLVCHYKVQGQDRVTPRTWEKIKKGASRLQGPLGPTARFNVPPLKGHAVCGRYSQPQPRCLFLAAPVRRASFHATQDERSVFCFSRNGRTCSSPHRATVSRRPPLLR